MNKWRINAYIIIQGINITEIRLRACGVFYCTFPFGFHGNPTGMKMYVISSDSGEGYRWGRVLGQRRSSVSFLLYLFSNLKKRKKETLKSTLFYQTVNTLVLTGKLLYYPGANVLGIDWASKHIFSSDVNITVGDWVSSLLGIEHFRKLLG